MFFDPSHCARWILIQTMFLIQRAWIETRDPSNPREVPAGRGPASHQASDEGRGPRQGRRGPYDCRARGREA
eukprot:5367692-Pyramimonas_sp.AAC.1